jgi:hypothetical protein
MRNDVLYKIGLILLKPAVYSCPPHMSKLNFLADLWGVTDRPITTYKVLKKFKIPGAERYSDTLRVEGQVKDTTAPVDALVFVRKEPALKEYHLEIRTKQQSPYRVFILTEEQFERIKSFLG